MDQKVSGGIHIPIYLDDMATESSALMAAWISIKIVILALLIALREPSGTLG